MATSHQEVIEFLNGIGVRHRVSDDGKIRFMYGMKSYKNERGDDGLLFVIYLSENGEYFQVYCPNAWKVAPGHADAVQRACTMIQWRTKLIQFEYDDTDGELRVIVEFPLEDAKLTEKQLHRCISGLLQLVDEYHETIQKAIDTGNVAMPRPQASAPGTADAAIRMAILALEGEGRPPNDPQILALRALLSGGAAGPATL